MHSALEPLFQKSLLSLAITILLVTICYFWIDAPLAIWIHEHGIRNFSLLKLITHLPEIIFVLCGAYYCYFWGISSKWERLSTRLNHLSRYPLLNVANSVVIALFVKDFLKIVFGRYWPETWKENNLSLIQNHAYGFHFFHQGVAFQSFPSGHSVTIVAFVVAIMLNFQISKTVRLLLFLGAVATILGLIGSNYHFLGDCIAGIWLGVTVANYVWWWSSCANKELLREEPQR